MGRAERTRNAGRSEGGACEASISAGVPNCGGVHGSQIQAGKGGEIDGKTDGAGAEGTGELCGAAAEDDRDGSEDPGGIRTGHGRDAGRQECMRQKTEVFVNYIGMELNRGLQYETGREYEAKEEQKCFRIYENPLDVFLLHPPASGRFFEVEKSWGSSRFENEIRSPKIKIGAELSLLGMVIAAIDYTARHRGRCSAVYDGAAGGAAHCGPLRGTANIRGIRGVASATGRISAAMAEGDRSIAAASGDESAACACGYKGIANATGIRSAAYATGDGGAACVTDDSSTATSTGDWGTACATGNGSAATATGKASVAVAAGLHGKARGSIGSVLFLVERQETGDDDAPVPRKILEAKAVIVDGVNIKPGIWYTLRDGELIEA